jgi:hypothetical protein
MRPTTSKKPLINWMLNGDPDLVPILMGDPRSTASSYFDVPLRVEGESISFTDVVGSRITPEMVIQCAKETGMHIHISLGGATHLDALEFMPDVVTVVRQEVDSAKAVRKSTSIKTPKGALDEMFVTPVGKPAYWESHLVKSDADMEAFAYLIRETARVSLEDSRFAQGLKAKYSAQAAQWPDWVPLYVMIGVPAFALTCNLYMGTGDSFLIMEDHKDLMEELFEHCAATNEVALKCAAESGADITLGAINGLEIYSPSYYTNYFIRQAKQIHDTAHSLGMLGWVHTCGLMRQLIERNTYAQMDNDIQESLSHPPLGDLDDLRQARVALGDRIVTRGAVNVSLFYDYAASTEEVRDRTKYVLDQTRGFRHMIGDTNDSYPPYSRDNVMAMVDEVQRSGRMLEAQPKSRQGG